MDSAKLSVKAAGETTPEMPEEPHIAVQVMHGITFSALVITFSVLFSTIAQASLIS